MSSSSDKIGRRFEALLTMYRIGTLYNNIPGQNRKDLVEKWAKDSYLAIWVELEGFGQLTAKEGHRLFRMPKEEIKA